MIISITSNTFHSHDSGEVSSCRPLDFVVNVNHSILSFYSLNSTLVTQYDADRLWSIIESGKSESHGVDTAIVRPYTVIKILGSRVEEYQEKIVNYRILINHFGGLGCSETLNHIIGSIMGTFESLHPSDIHFLNLLS